jgi:hypothetical protein
MEDKKVRAITNRAGLTVAVVFGLALGVGAQQSPPPDEGPGGPSVTFQTRVPGPGGPADGVGTASGDRIFIRTGGPGPGGPMEGVFFFEGMVGRFGGKTVTGKPFSANVTITRSQQLPDGTTIENTTTGLLARNVSGSTYRDSKLPAIGPLAASGGAPPEFVNIHDVTANKDYVLNVNKKTYREFSIRQRGPKPNGDSGGVVYRQRGGPTASGSNNAPAPQIVNYDSLNNVEYTKTTRTIPKGQIGNSADIVISTERWYSPDLQLLLKETHTDPRFGTTTYALSGITLTPDPALFSVPSGYTLNQTTGGFSRRGRGQNLPPPPPQD